MAKRGWDEVSETKTERTPLVSKLVLLLDRALALINGLPVTGDSPVKRERFRKLRADMTAERDALIGSLESGGVPRT